MVVGIGSILTKIRKYRWLIIACLVLLLTNIRFDLEIAPERTLQILDDSGNPVTNAFVRQHWVHYSFDLKKERDLKVDKSGRVLLARRTVRATIASVAFGALGRIIRYGINASFGSDEMIGVFAPGYLHKWVEDEQELRTGIIRLIHSPGR